MPPPIQPLATGRGASIPRMNPTYVAGWMTVLPQFHSRPSSSETKRRLGDTGPTYETHLRRICPVLVIPMALGPLQTAPETISGKQYQPNPPPHLGFAATNPCGVFKTIG